MSILKSIHGRYYMEAKIWILYLQTTVSFSFYHIDSMQKAVNDVIDISTVFFNKPSRAIRLISGQFDGQTNKI